MSFPRYPKYKDSGVEWLGQVPAQWQRLPLKVVASHNDAVLDETTAPDFELQYVDISGVDALQGIHTKEVRGCPARAEPRAGVPGPHAIVRLLR